MVYSATLVSGRANGGLHEMLTVERSIKEEDKSAFEGNEPVKKISLSTCTKTILESQNHGPISPLSKLHVFLT